MSRRRLFHKKPEPKLDKKKLCFYKPGLFVSRPKVHEFLKAKASAYTYRFQVIIERNEKVLVCVQRSQNEGENEI